MSNINFVEKDLSEKMNKLNINGSDTILRNIGNKIINTDDINELDYLLNNLSLSDNISKEDKKIIFYWVGLQIDSINKKLMEKEKSQICLAF